jgi:dTDP-4-dehydrorhamnose 3,5-epimerase
VIFTNTNLAGAYIIEPEPAIDERGYFARTYCSQEFERHGLNLRVAQCDISYNRKKGTLRGLHYQVAPLSEAKLVTCIAGSIYDVIVDLRPESPDYCQWFAVRLSARQPRSMLYIPENFAHGFQTLEDDTEIFYHMSQPYHPAAAKGVRWNDPALCIVWPEDHRIISERDKSFPDYVP